MQRLRNLTTVPLAMQSPAQRVLTAASLKVLPHVPVLQTTAGATAALSFVALASFWNPDLPSPIPTWSEKHFAEFVMQMDRAIGGQSPARGSLEQGSAVEATGSLLGVRNTDVLSRAQPGPTTHTNRSLAKEQATLAQYLAKRYRVAQDTTQEFVEMSYRVARDLKLDPWLILAIMGIESSFDPQARSDKGAQGLMQVLTRVHADKFAPFGGVSAAFDPLSNIMVGAQILKSYIDRDGNIAGALKSYVGAAFMPTDGGYGAKVLTERERLAAIAQGRPMNEAAVKASLAVLTVAAPVATATGMLVTGSTPSIIEVKSAAEGATVSLMAPVGQSITETVRAEALKAESLKPEGLRFDAPRPDSLRFDSPKNEIRDAAERALNGDAAEGLSAAP